MKVILSWVAYMIVTPALMLGMILYPEVTSVEIAAWVYVAWMMISYAIASFGVFMLIRSLPKLMRYHPNGRSPANIVHPTLWLEALTNMALLVLFAGTYALWFALICAFFWGAFYALIFQYNIKVPSNAK